MTNTEQVKQLVCAELERQRAALDAMKGLTFVQATLNRGKGADPEVTLEFSSRRRILAGWGE